MQMRAVVVALALGSVVVPTMQYEAQGGEAQGGEPDAAVPRILMVTQSAGFRHRPVNREARDYALAELAMIELAKKSAEFSVDCSQDAARDLTKQNLQNYDIVAFYTTGDLPISLFDLDYFLNEWLHEAGHGFIGFHSATDTFKDYRPYWDMIGGTFNGHPWGQNAQVTVQVHDPDHPAMRPFGSSFEFTDEIYEYRNWQPQKVHVLMSLDMSKTKLKRPYHVPVAWAKEIGEGKLFYTNLGHRDETWRNEKFLESIIGAVRWIAGKEAASAKPNPEVSAAHQEHSEEAARAAGISLEALEEAQRARQAANKARQAAQKAKKEAKAASEAAPAE